MDVLGLHGHVRLTTTLIPGCTPTILMEAPPSLVTVEPQPPAVNSHPGPVHDTEEGVFQAVTTGKYTLSVYYQNVRGLRTKIVQLRLLLSSCDYDVLVFTETWLRADIDSAEISPNYTFYRCDRNAISSQYSRGGGVLIAVKTHLNCEIVPMLNCEHLEQVAVCIRRQFRCLYLVVIYLPPNSCADLYSAHANAVQHIVNLASTTDIIVSVGDFNLPNLRWQLDEDVNGFIPSNVSSEHEQALIETMFTSGLQQINRYVNVNARLLDLIFVNRPEQLDILEPSVPLLPVDNHHVPFILLLDESADDFIEQTEPDDNLLYDLQSCDFGQLKTALDDIDWNSILLNGSVDGIVSIFYDKLHSVLREHVQRKRRTSHIFSKPWWTSELRHIRNVLRKARRRFFISKSQRDREYLREIEVSYKSVLSSTYNNYLYRIQASIRQNPLRFWRFVKERQT
ncbi:uncharacterized protein LOC129766419 [Toxorhynchites rutilus septentrionalis]|uniref:uncharacterized protein LOC129766419 n=1 Tax=Toxorhynchites rutilus septentrionalis TaxID=329112 RepID=UPI00247A9A1A|nr:uncharacterized protein LOC129766419 [Toxorhynchites rutilus septentrionalis]